MDIKSRINKSKWKLFYPVLIVLFLLWILLFMTMIIAAVVCKDDSSILVMNFLCFGILLILFSIFTYYIYTLGNKTAQITMKNYENLQYDDKVIFDNELKELGKVNSVVFSDKWMFYNEAKNCQIFSFVKYEDIIWIYLKYMTGVIPSRYGGAGKPIRSGMIVFYDRYKQMHVINNSSMTRNAQYLYDDIKERIPYAYKGYNKKMKEMFKNEFDFMVSNVSNFTQDN